MFSPRTAPLGLDPSPNWRRRPFSIVVFLAIVLLSTVLLLLYPAKQAGTATTTVTTPTRVRLTLVLAHTPTTRSQGLSQLHAIPHDGLLLLWPDAGQHPIWMEGMQFPLDLIWCDVAGRVLAIERNVPTCTAMSECPLYGVSIRSSRVVVELYAHRAEALGIQVGDQLDIAALPLK